MERIKNIALFVSTLLVIIMIDRSCKQQTIIRELGQLATDTPAVTHYQDKSGLQHTVTPVTGNTNQPQVIQAARQTNISKKNIRSVSVGQVHTSDTIYISSPLIIKDTMQFTYEDKWLLLHGRWDTSLQLSYSIRDSIWFVQYRKKTGLFQKADYMDGYSSNPHTIITGLSSIRTDGTKKAPLRISIGPSAGYHYHDGRFSWSVGISVQYNLIRL